MSDNALMLGVTITICVAIILVFGSAAQAWAERGRRSDKDDNPQG